ncbi:MAG: TIGR02281 family clan AA aspartic protease [Alphaproteobacteria bacterium]|nr:TIGR02281 family clan AA aspartic protease [Alphaproteobacteria bacterium]
MLKPLLVVMGIGAGIGLLWPTGHASAPGPAPARAVAAAPVAPGEIRSGSGQQTLLKRASGGHFYTDVEVNGQLVHVVVDTGATDVALTVDDARRIGIPFSEAEFQVVGEGASGPVRGKVVTLDRVSLEGKDVQGVRAVVLEGLPISLLGQGYLSHVSVEMSGDYMRLD